MNDAITSKERVTHEQRVVQHASGWRETMATCVCGLAWPCPETLRSEQVAFAFIRELQKRFSVTAPLSDIEMAQEQGWHHDVAQVCAAYDAAHSSHETGDEQVRRDRDANLAAWERVLGQRSEGEALSWIAGMRSTLTNVAQLMDAWKQTAPEQWTAWDQEQRDAITAHLTHPETKAPHECRRGPSCGMLDGAWECNCAPESCGDPILRRLLWLCYTHGVGYRDDGELQDNRAQPFIDFRRDAPHDIEEKMRERGYRQLVAAEKARGES